jgi:aspartate carbamoyltransferase catalytic subunit
LGVTVETNLQKALQWADVANVLRVQFERMRTSFFPSNREYAMQYGISKQLVEQLDNDLLIMHPGPINRGVEISSDLADSEHAIILDQVENGVAVRMAILYLLASKIEQ